MAEKEETNGNIPSRLEEFPLRVKCFGVPAAFDCSGRPIPIQTRKALAVLLYLLSVPNGVATREKIASVLWSRADEAKAAQSLRQALRHIRRIEAEIDAPLIEADKAYLRIVSKSIRTDLQDLKDCLRRGSAEDYQRAGALLSGELYSGLEGIDPEFEEWVSAERSGLVMDCTAQTLNAIDNLSFTRHGDLVEAGCRFLLQLDSAYEYVHQLLIKLYLAKGRHGEAMQQYRRCADELKRLLDSEPDQETRLLLQDYEPDAGLQMERVNHPAAAMATALVGTGEGHVPVELPRVMLLPIGVWPAPETRAAFMLDDLRKGLTAFGNTQVFQVDLDPLLQTMPEMPLGSAHLGNYGLRFRCDDRLDTLFLQFESLPSGRVIFNEQLSFADCADRAGFQLVTGRIVNRIQTQIVGHLRHGVGKDVFSRWSQIEGLLLEFSPLADERACKLLNELELFDPDFSLTYAGWASIELRKRFHYPSRKRHEASAAKILELAERSLLLDPWQPFARRMYGFALLNCGYGQEAEKAFRNAVKMNPYDPTNLLSCAEGLAFAGCIDEVPSLVDTAMELFPIQPRFLNEYLANIRLAVGDFSGALAALDRMPKATVACLATRVATLVCLGREHEIEQCVDDFIAEQGSGPFLETSRDIQQFRLSQNSEELAHYQTQWREDIAKWLSRVNYFQDPARRAMFEKGAQLLLADWKKRLFDDA